MDLSHIVKENLYITNQISTDLAIILVLLSVAGQNIAVFGMVQIPSVMVTIHITCELGIFKGEWQCA